MPDFSKPDDAPGPPPAGPPYAPPPNAPPTGGWGAPPGGPPGGYGGYGGGYGGYGAPGPYGYGGPPPPPSRPTNNNALASLILGVAGFVVGCVIPVTAVLAVVFGHKARREIEASGGWEDGAGLATAGIILGWIGIGLTILGTLLLVLFLIAAAGSDSSSLPLLAGLAV